MAKVETKNTLTPFVSFLTWPFRKFKAMSKVGKVLVVVVIALIALGQINSYRNSGLEVSTASPKFGKITESISAPGEIAADKSANLSFQTPGEVAELNFKTGDFVEKGTIVAKLDTTTLYATYKQAQATLRASQAALNYTYDTLKGKETTETFSEISARTQAETTKDKSYWAFTAASEALSGAYIKAPFDGILTQVPANIFPGSVVGLPSSSIFQIVGPETLYFDSEVSELDIFKLKIGSKTEIELDAYPQDMFSGFVEGYNFASFQTSTGGTSYKVRISLPEKNAEKFRIGMNGDAEVILSEKENVLLVPITAIVEEDDKTFVWKKNGSIATRVEIQTGISSVNDIEIISGLSEEDKIIIRPPSQIKEGARIKEKIDTSTK